MQIIFLLNSFLQSISNAVSHQGFFFSTGTSQISQVSLVTFLFSLIFLAFFTNVSPCCASTNRTLKLLIFRRRSHLIGQSSLYQDPTGRALLNSLRPHPPLLGNLNNFLSNVCLRPALKYMIWQLILVETSNPEYLFISWLIIKSAL